MIKRVLQLASYQKQRILFILSAGFMVIGFGALVWSIWQVPDVKAALPWVDNQIMAYKYERLARKLPPGDVQATRLRAMAEAMRKNSHNYAFTTGPLPVTSGK